jgi:drug/metabolite transporter (DMT)-like permease
MSAPFAKLLLPRVDPWVLAALLYLGAGAGLAVMRVAQADRGGAALRRRRRLRREDLPMLLAIAIIGGGVGPVLMMVGLRALSGVAGALLLNLEAVFTMLLAVTVFGERLSTREALAAVVVLAGAVLVSLRGGPIRGEQLAAALIAAACLAWAIDNNLTVRLSGRNAIDVVQFKAMTAGLGNLFLAFATGHMLPSLTIVAVALGVGFVSYGLSIVLDFYALRYVGAARESAYFATAPFAGAIAAVPLLGERVTPNEITGGLVMAAGVALLIAARNAPGRERT